MKILRLFIAIIIMLSLNGCASVSLVKTWKDQNVPKKTYHNLLVVGISENRQMRQVFEEVLAGELRKKGISATASYKITGVEEKLSRDLVVKAVKTVAADGVMATRIVDRTKEKRVNVGYEMTSRGYDSYVDFYGTGTVSYATFDMKPVEVTISTTTSIATDIFDSSTQTLVWSGASNAVKPEGIIKVTEEFAAVIIKAISEEGLLP